MKEAIKFSLREKLNKKLKKAAGVLIKANDSGKVLLLLRNDKTPKWSLMSGSLDNEENPLECIKREIIEELSIDPSIIEFKSVGNEYVTDNLIFHYFQGLTKKEFIPKLDYENLDFGWFDKTNLPSPLFAGMDEKIANI